MIHATVTITKAGKPPVIFDAIGRNIDAISASAEQLAGDEPFGLSVMVQP